MCEENPRSQEGVSSVRTAPLESEARPGNGARPLSAQCLTEHQLLEREAAATRSLQRQVDLMIQQAQRHEDHTSETSMQCLTEHQLLEREAASLRALQKEVDAAILQAQRYDGWTMSVC
jgi:hypothetical protein